MENNEASFEVVWPLGKFVSRPVQAAPALTDLSGKTVVEMWGWVFKGYEIYARLNKALREKYPGIKIIDHETMGNSHAANEREYVADLPNLLKKLGCDAVISGVGA